MSQPYEYQFSRDLDHKTPVTPQRTLIIASTPRCGSHMLGHSLLKTGRFGAPFEYLNHRNLARWKEILGTSGLQDTLGALMKRRTSKNGVFAIKLHHSHTRHFTDPKAMYALFPNPHFVQIERSDLLAQAISYSKARQTGVWIQGQKGNGRRATYDATDIESCLESIVHQRASWDYEIASLGVPNLKVSFADAVDDIGKVIGRIADLLDVRLPTDQILDEPATSRQAGSENKDWRERILKDYKGRRFLQDRGTAARSGILRPGLGKVGRRVKTALGLS